MTLLFVVGVMNLMWVALLTVLVLAEKLVPGRLVSRLSGVAAIFWGFYVLLVARS
jgi:predicted metal-binding membrane protein